MNSTFFLQDPSLFRRQAFVAGRWCDAVAKPAQSTPFSALALAVLGERAGLPAGLFLCLDGQFNGTLGPK